MTHGAELEYRWRHTIIAVVAALFMLLVLVGSSVVAMAHREVERMEGRTGLLASQPSPTDLFVIERDDKWHGEQFPVVWIEPAGDVKPVLPPGMDRLPKPGQAVVSPGLNQLASSHSGLAARYPNRLVLAAGGVVSEDELLAYARMPQGMSLSRDIRAVRIRSFGSPTGDKKINELYPTSGLVPVGGAVRGVLGFLVIPGLVVLAVGLAAPGGVRGGNFRALLLAMPGLVGVTVLWGAVSPLMERIPLVQHDILRGDLALPWWLLLAELGVCAGMIGLIPVLMTASLRRRRVKGCESDPPLRRPGALPVASTSLTLAVFSSAAYWYSGHVGGDFEATLKLASVVATVTGLSLILLGALRGLGAWLSELQSVPAQVAGSDIERDPVGTAQPFLGLIVIVVVALVASGYYVTGRDVKAPFPSNEGTQAVFVEWFDPHPDHPSRLADAIGTGLVVPFGESRHAHEHDHSHQGALALGTTCRQLVPYFTGTTCSPNAPYELPEWTKQRLAEVTSMASHNPDAEVRLGPANDVATSGSAMVLDKAPLGDLEKRVRGVAMRELPAPYVYSLLSKVLHVSPTTAWITPGFTIAIIVLAVGCLISLANNLVDTRTHDARERRYRFLLARGVSPRLLPSLEAWRFAAPYSVVVTVSFLTGLATCTTIVKLFPWKIPMPWPWIGATLGTAVVIGIVGTILAGFLGARSVRKNHG